MSPLRFHRWAMFLPVGIPILAFPFIGGRNSEALVPSIAGAALFVVVAGTMGMIPFLCTAVPLALWSRGRSLSAVRRGLLVAPILMVGSNTVFMLILNGPWEFQHARAWNFLGFTGALILALGYAYVALVLGLGRVLERRSGRDAEFRGSDEV